MTVERRPKNIRLPNIANGRALLHLKNYVLTEPANSRASAGAARRARQLWYPSCDNTWLAVPWPNCLTFEVVTE